MTAERFVNEREKVKELYPGLSQEEAQGVALCTLSIVTGMTILQIKNQLKSMNPPVLTS